MKCYNYRCKDNCDKYKQAACLFKMNKEQAELSRQINKIELCPTCGKGLVNIKLKHQKKKAKMCMNCKEVVEC